MVILDLTVDDLADLLDEGAIVAKALEEIGTLIDGMDITLDEVIARFTEEYEATPEQYSENVKDDATWTETNILDSDSI